jgi:hypothetical protein
MASEKTCEIFGLNVSITQNAPQKFGMQSLLGMKRTVTLLPAEFL